MARGPHVTCAFGLPRFSLCATLIIITGLGTPSALHAQGQPELDVQIVPTWQAARDAALDTLFEQLQSARDGETSERVAEKIYARFRQSGSDTLDLLAVRAREAISKAEYPVAVEIMSRVIALSPDWADAWNLRATAFFMMGDNDQAKADVVETLSREPRHIGALTGLGLIFELQGQPKEALKAYRQALLLAPQLPVVKSSVERLAKELEQPM